MMNPPFLLQLPHNSINCREAGHAIFPCLQKSFVCGPLDLFAHGVADHFIEVGGLVAGEVEELTEEELAMQRLRRI